MALALGWLLAANAFAREPGLVVVTDINYPPYLFQEADGALKGILKDKWDLWSQRNGVPVTVRGMEWSEAQKAVLSGEADVVEAITFREDRAKLYEFSRPYAPIEAHVYFHSSISGVNDVASMRGFKVGAKAGSACGNWLRERGIEDLVEYPTSEALVKAAVADRIRLFCMDAPAAQYFLYKLDLAGAYRRTAPLYESQFHWAVKKGRAELRDRIELGFDKLSEAELQEIDARWLGNPLRFPIGTRYLAYIGAAVALLVALGVLLLLWNGVLRTRVAARTAELSASERRFRSLGEFVASYMWELDDQLRFSWVMGRHMEDFGLRAEDMIGRRSDELGINFELISPSLKEFTEARAQRLPYRNVRGRMWRADGAERFVAFWGEPMFHADGRFKGYRGLTQDITENMRLERELERLNQTLEQRVAERTAELGKANRELEAFAYSISHDLRAPLRAIDRHAQAALDGSAGKVGDDVLRSLGRVRASSQRMGQLINDLLALSQVARAELRREPVDLSALVAEIAADLRGADAARNVKFGVQPGMLAHADRSLLRIVLENLLGNAWKFTQRRDEARIEVRAETIDGETAFAVRDNGAGFDMRYAGKLFHAFERLHGEADFPGTGIGLAIVERIVSRHGGRVWAEGVPDEGAVFRFTLGRDA